MKSVDASSKYLHSIILVCIVLCMVKCFLMFFSGNFTILQKIAFIYILIYQIYMENTDSASIFVTSEAVNYWTTLLLLT